MPLQLTPEQEERIKTVVSTGAYASAEEAINAAVTAVETAAVHFDGTPDELEALLKEGRDSRELSEEEFWREVDRNTNRMLFERKRDPGA